MALAERRVRTTLVRPAHVRKVVLLLNHPFESHAHTHDEPRAATGATIAVAGASIGVRHVHALAERPHTNCNPDGISNANNATTYCIDVSPFGVVAFQSLSRSRKSHSTAFRSFSRDVASQES